MCYVPIYSVLSPGPCPHFIYYYPTSTHPHPLVTHQYLPCLLQCASSRAEVRGHRQGSVHILLKHIRSLLGHFISGAGGGRRLASRPLTGHCFTKYYANHGPVVAAHIAAPRRLAVVSCQTASPVCPTQTRAALISVVINEV